MVVSENQINLKEIDFTNKTLEDKMIDIVSLSDLAIDLLLYPQDLEDPGLIHLMEKEQKFYPIYTFESLNLSKESAKNFAANELKAIYTKAATRWVLTHNIQTIEQIFPTISYLKDLWIKDRNTFFEELWFLLKTNLATQELSLIFHDLKEPSQKQTDKGEKPKLCHSYVQGKKLPHLFPGKEKEEVLMKEYENEFGQFFNITEYVPEKGQLIACAQIGLSPILIMAKLNQFNQLQQSILIGIFTGLQDQE